MTSWLFLGPTQLYNYPFQMVDFMNFVQLAARSSGSLDIGPVVNVDGVRVENDVDAIHCKSVTPEKYALSLMDSPCCDPVPSLFIGESSVDGVTLPTGVFPHCLSICGSWCFAVSMPLHNIAGSCNYCVSQ